MFVKRLLLGSFAVACCFGSGAGTVVYQNDFSMRRSIVKPQPGPWRTYEYSVDARLAHNYSSPNYGSVFFENLPWSDPSQQQDGWVHGGSGENNFPGAWVRTNSEEECPGDTTHRFGTFEFNAAIHTWNRVMQPIGNSFSNGVVRYTVDMRPPKWWGVANFGYWTPLFRFYPAFRRDLRNPDFGNATEENPCAIGFTRKSEGTGTADNVLVEGANKCFRTGSQPNQIYVSESLVTPGNWYRCFVELDIDNKTVDTSMYDMGDRVPDINAECGPCVLYQDGPEAWRWPIDETRGPIDGIAFQTEGINSFGVITNMPCFTNIKVEWKAPGTEEFLCCYENDFTTCRKRTLVPMSESYDYPEITPVVETTTSAAYQIAMAASEFPDTASDAALVPKQESGGGVLQPVGFDNWRRISFMNWAAATIADYDGDKKFRVTWPWGDDTSEQVIGLFTQPLGEPITSGKVRLVCDIRTPSNFWYTANSGLYVMLGDRKHYTSFGEVGSAVTYAAFAGIGQDGQGHCYPEMKTGGGWSSDSSCGCAFSHWYRVELVAEVENRTYAYRLYDIEGATPDVPIYAISGLAFAATQAEPNIAAFTLSSYGAGKEPGNEHLYDNVVVWKNWDEATGAGEEIYRNDFSIRTRYSARASKQLADAPNLTLGEKDYWTIRGGDSAGVLRTLGKNDNPCASFCSSEKNPYAMQDFGGEFRRGKLTFSADIRPPNVWNRNVFSGREASVYVGGQKMAQGNLGYGRSIYGSAAMCFGFDGGGMPYDEKGLCLYVAPYVMSGSATLYFDPKFVDATHWYRFVSKFDIKAKKVDVVLYDMGTSHPEPDTPLGNKIAEATDLDFVDSTVEELSTACLHVIGGRESMPWWRCEDEGCAFIDNLKAEYEPNGLTVIIR